MKISIVSIGSLSSDYAVLSKEYIKRISAYGKIEFVSVKEEKGKDNLKEKIIEEEGRRILEKINNFQCVISLDKSGKEFDSESFSCFLKDKMEDRLEGHVCFVIGGAFGLSQAVLKKSNFIFSLSKLTFTHDMAQFILLEQIYRAIEIWKGSKYHK